MFIFKLVFSEINNKNGINNYEVSTSNYTDIHTSLILLFSLEVTLFSLKLFIPFDVNFVDFS